MSGGCGTDPEDFGLPHPHTAADIDFTQHRYVSPGCTHGQHDACDDGCRFCGSLCDCVCHSGRFAVERG